LIQILLVAFTASILSGCVDPEATLTATPMPEVVVTVTRSPSPTPEPSPTPTIALPKSLVFYGDSSLAIGDSGDDIDHVGFSFVTNLIPMMNDSYEFIVSNYGGKTARWGYEYLDEYVLSHSPDLVTLWWGFDDMGGCPGSFDRETNRLLEHRLDAIVEEHILYLTYQIDQLVQLNIPVMVMTPVPALSGQLPWSDLDEDNTLIWEEGRWCDFNQALYVLVQAQRTLVLDYVARDMPVALVDVWQVYEDHPDTEKMYMDVVHPASNGAQLIAEEWFKQYQILITEISK